MSTKSLNYKIYDPIDSRDIAKGCRLAAVKLVPEISILEEANNPNFAGKFDDTMALIAFGAGQVLARWFLDYPETIKDKKVLDFGAGSGIVAMAAAKAGARKVLAIDDDPNALKIIQRNSHANNVVVSTRQGSNKTLLALKDSFDVITATDIFYNFGNGLEELIIDIARSGKTVYAGSYLERTPLLIRFGKALSVSSNITGNPEAQHKSRLQSFVMMDANTVSLEDNKQKNNSLLAQEHLRQPQRRQILAT